MNYDIKIFNNDNFGQVRTTLIDGEVWFVGKDVAEALGYKDTVNAIKAHVDDEDKMGWQITTPSRGIQTAVVINESGLYALTLSSKLPQAREFKRWVTKEVIPSIRKTGEYRIMKTEDDIETKAKAALVWVNGVAEIMNLNESSKLLLLQQCGQQFGLPTPSYARTKDSLYSATELLKRNNISLTNRAFNKLAIANGYMEKKTRFSTHGKVKYYNSLTKKAQSYGENQVCPQNPNETHPLYYEGSFMELCKALEISK